MGLFQDIAAGAGRATTMMNRLGIDQDELLGGDPCAAGLQLRQRALGCAACKSRSECDRLLASNTRLRTAPNYCPNKRELDALAHA